MSKPGSHVVDTPPVEGGHTTLDARCSRRQRPLLPETAAGTLEPDPSGSGGRPAELRRPFPLREYASTPIWLVAVVDHRQVCLPGTGGDFVEGRAKTLSSDVRRGSHVSARM